MQLKKNATALIDSVAPNKVNVSDAVLIGETMAYSFCNSLPYGFANK